jgi:hypothetical protein
MPNGGVSVMRTRGLTAMIKMSILGFDNVASDPCADSNALQQ